jgi:hypothetical protein
MQLDAHPATIDDHMVDARARGDCDRRRCSEWEGDWLLNATTGK